MVLISRDQHQRCTTIPRISLVVSGGVCECVSLAAAQAWKGRAGPILDGHTGSYGTFLTLYVHRSVFQAAQRTRGGVVPHRFGPRVQRREEGSELGGCSSPMPCLSAFLPAPQDGGTHCTADQGIQGTSQVICSGNTSVYLPCPGAVAIASVPPPVRPQRDGQRRQNQPALASSTWDGDKKKKQTPYIPVDAL